MTQRASKWVAAIVSAVVAIVLLLISLVVIAGLFRLLFLVLDAG